MSSESTNHSGYFRIALAVPDVKPAAVRHNGDAIVQCFMDACEQGANLVLFPELSITGYTCGDLFLQSRLLDAAEAEAIRVIHETSARSSLLIFGMPLARRGSVYNAAVVVRGGNSILGIVPKTYIPNTGEYYEQRWFASAEDARFNEVSFAGQKIPFGTDILFRHENSRETTFAVELCEDLWSPIPPSSRHAVAGATMLFNLSASSELAGKSDYRCRLVEQQSARCLAAYACASAGPGESTTDMVFGGHAIVAENGKILIQSSRFPTASDIVLADIDTELLMHERLASRTYGDSARRELHSISYRTVRFGGRLHYGSAAHGKLYRPIDPHPFIPDNAEEREHRCQEIASIQETGLATRMKHTGIRNVVIGLSGGLDSTLALIITIRAFQRLELPLSGLYPITMPGFGTTKRTLDNVKTLCSCLGLNLDIIDIREICRLQMEDLSHSGTPSEHNTAYENIQARYRTAILMNKANMLEGLVIGTGDMSEMALGWCTYNGDHMSMYAVNIGVPKTLVRYLVEWAAEAWVIPEARAIIHDILDTPISPELLPPDAEGRIAQKTEETIGPYELHDFFLYQAIRRGFSPNKVYWMACSAFPDKYDTAAIAHWLKVFYKRFFSQQFKRSCVPDGPKVGSIALSPRSDWRMPSDADVSAWLAELENLG